GSDLSGRQAAGAFEEKTMRFRGAVAAGVLTICAGATLSAVRAQQPAGFIQPVVATVDALPGPLGHRPLATASMPSRVAGPLADRLQALHDPSAANTDQAEPASPILPPAATTAEWKPAELLPPAAQSALSPPASPPAPAPAPRRNPLFGDRHSFGIANPLRGAR
ncbi:MAG TPA: hypothetical protein VIK18_01615, partial [Pirellulales bacterium]